ncbi:MAG: S-layer homology domain-containing protein [Clostridia bacterium]|nr:S-layer homology domain-containing protein [Clostridia bacterium]
MMKRTISIFLALLMVFGVFPLWISAAEPLDNPFEDVTESDWFWKEVLTVNEEGIMTGKSATVFDPKANISRAEVVTALARFACVNVKGKGEALAFHDTVTDGWYSDYVGWAFENGIVTGYDNGNFGPSDLITRQELAVVVSRMIKYLEATMPENP